MPNRIAYLPLNTYPEALPDDAVRGAAGFAATLGCRLHVTAFAATLPKMASPLGGVLLDVPALVQAAEDKSRAEAQRLLDLVAATVSGATPAELTTGTAAAGTVPEAAAAEARYFDLTLLPWSAEGAAAQDVPQAVIFGSGRPAILVPPGPAPAALDHIAIAWDESRVAARALGDALPLLAAGGRVTVLTVRNEKHLRDTGLAQTLAAALRLRGIAASHADLELGDGSIAEALQRGASEAGARLLAMGGFGHSRLRDFVLGGATKGILAQLALPTLLSH
jgi:nucleotide-binding universal stress UspA family protein